MAPPVKQGDGEDPNALLVGLGRLTLTVDDYARAVQISDRIETREQWQDRFILEQGELVDELIEQRRALRRIVRKWEIAFALLVAQFLVVAVAAVWGWAR